MRSVYFCLVFIVDLFSIHFLNSLLFQFYNQKLSKAQRTKFLMDRVSIWLKSNKIGSIKFVKVDPTLLLLAIPVEVIIVQGKVSCKKCMFPLKETLYVQMKYCMDKVTPEMVKKDRSIIMTCLSGQAGADASYAFFLVRLTVLHEYFFKAMKTVDKPKPKGLICFSEKLSRCIRKLVRIYAEYLDEFNKRPKKKLVAIKPEKDSDDELIKDMKRKPKRKREK
jgi:hypothetical protein